MKLYKTLDNGIKIAEYDDSLAGAIADMWNKSSDSWGGGSAIETADRIIMQHAGSSFINVYIALYNGEAVGYCSFARYYKDAGTLYIATLNVRPDFHGQKVGKELVLMCVERTIELGYARLDIHTWPGNTKAVPLYKKCGYFWEDRSDSTHLSNFIPTVLNTELTKDFFKKASWYHDSTRIIEIKKDGIKLNGFEVYKYSWEKDGEILDVGFENSGRRMRLVETNDYKIEMIAEDHKLAFGLNYWCKFEITNKTGKTLEVEIKGKNDGIIKFDYTAKETVDEQKTLEASFFVDSITEEQDTWRMHPCVLADVVINGKKAEFGLGIEAKFPLKVFLKQLRGIPQIGMMEDCYINIISALKKDASVSFCLPDNKITRFSTDKININIAADSKACVKTVSEVTGYGHEGLPLKYNILLDDGSEIIFEKTLHIENRGLTTSFSYENDDHYALVNGSWFLGMNKNNNNVHASSVAGTGSCGFPVPKLGKPYQDEFDLIKPSAVKMFKENDLMIMEATFTSEKQPGVEVAEIFTLASAGVVTRRLRVKNTSKDIKSLTIKDELHLPLGDKTVFHYNGGIFEAKDCQAYGVSFIDSEKIDENWIYENDEKHPRGVYWPPEYKLNTMWGSIIFFEHQTGELQEGDTFETKPVVSVSDLFYSFNDFRNYVLKIFNRIPPFTSDNIEFKINGYNPFITKAIIEAAVINLRNKKMEGEIIVNSPDGLFDTETQHNEADNREEIKFNLKPKTAVPGIYMAGFDLKLAGGDIERQKALFLTDGGVETVEKDGIYEVSNGVITFKASPAFSDAVYSLKYKDDEYLHNHYPKLEPYSWWNPFVGGVKSMLAKMSADLVAREHITARFTNETDCFGNIWRGIATEVEITKFEEHKGIAYTQYFLTLEGLPVLCSFTRVHNNTGQYKSVNLQQHIFINPVENGANLYCEGTTPDRTNFRSRMGAEPWDKSVDKLIKFIPDGRENIYIYKDTRKEGRLVCDIDNKTAYAFSGTAVNIECGGVYTTRPLFVIISGKEIILKSLEDLGRVIF